MKKSAAPHVQILFEDEQILVVAKPAGMLVHAAPGHEGEFTLTDFFVAHCPHAKSVGSVERPGVVHRLDQGTSGVMVLAKTQSAYLNLRRQFEAHTEVRKTYLAVCHGRFAQKKGQVDTPLGRPPRTALTHYEVLEFRNGLSMVEFKIATGRMHQIRLHAVELGHPVVGDDLYGDRARDAHLQSRPMRQLLHAVELSFIHPSTGERVTFAAIPPKDILYAH